MNTPQSRNLLAAAFIGALILSAAATQAKEATQSEGNKAVTATPTQNLTHTTEELNRRSVERRAIEAINWGMPAVNADLMLQALIKAGGNTNQIAIWAGLPDWKNQTLTPNPDVIYLMPFINTKNGR